MATWIGPTPPEITAPRGGEWVRFAVRAIVFSLAMVILLLAFWIARLLELPFRRRGLSGFVIWFACVMSNWLCGITVETVGAPMEKPGAWVCNHSSWLDIFVLRSAGQMFFVAKSEVRGWPVLGFIADQTGTMFIERKRTEAKRQEKMFFERLDRGDRLCFFPEGTSTDGLRVLPFKSTLFNVFMTPAMVEVAWIQPVTVFYEAPPARRSSFYGWWDTIGFGEHLMNVLAKSRGGRAKVIFHKAVRAADFPDRKALSLYCEEEIRRAHDAEIARKGIEVPVSRENGQGAD